MELSIPPLFAYIASWASVTGGVWALFERAEKVVRDDVRDAISRWLRNLDPGGALANWPAQFAAVFDRVFGERHLSWRCFGRSCVASFVFVAIVTFLWVALRPTLFTAFIQSARFDKDMFSVLSFVVIVNLIPDYLSLLETRYVIRWMRFSHSTVRVFFLLVFDLAATAVIFLGSLAVFLTFFLILGDTGLSIGEIAGALTEFLSTFVGLALPLSVAEPGFASPGIPFYSTFFTSVWVWLYALSGLAVKLTQHLGVGLAFLKRVLDIDNKPLRSIGFVSMMLVTLVYLIVPLVR